LVWRHCGSAVLTRKVQQQRQTDPEILGRLSASSLSRVGFKGGKAGTDLYFASTDRPTADPSRPETHTHETVRRIFTVRLLFPSSQSVIVQGVSMAKRSARRKYRDSAYESDNVHALFPPGGWSPLDRDRESRDRKYVKNIRAMSPQQQNLIDAIEERSVILALGPAGTGKTYIAISKAVEALEQNKVSRIVLSRPAVEAGESLGFLPGDMQEKLAPYLRPLYDALSDRLGGKRLKALIAEGIIEIAPVAFMRGRTLNNAFIVIDEAQNCTYGQLKMLLTRLGWQSTMVLTGDPDQTDLLPGISGFGDIANRLEQVPEISVTRLGDADIVRHPLVGSMLTVL
jgi:phosphate starvation-inducible PhoH-like protein